LNILIICLTTLDSSEFLGAKSKSKAKDLRLTPLNNSSRFGFITLPLALDSNPSGLVFAPNKFTNRD
jgi:hypothetical protein